jgi:indole-3-glycerol phosphate synthase
LNFIPNDRAVVSESGIKTAYDFDYLANLGIDAVLIGEAFMRSDSINETIVSLRSVKV